MIEAENTRGTDPAILVRACAGGVLMGLANLVPGISGGTMLLATGIYPRFIKAVAEVTTLRIRPANLALLVCIAGGAVLAILMLAGPTKDLVIEHRWAMYSLFIGLTLGGVPLVWRMARPATTPTWIGCAIGIALMAGLAIAQQSGIGENGAQGSDLAMLTLAGVAGASAMILPGVSGGYLLLVLGQYVPILSSIDRLKGALREQDFGAAIGEWSVVVPVGLGVVIGIAGVSNVLRWALRRHEKGTLGVLLGLLVGAIVGLWPFQRGEAPTPGDVVKGVTITSESAQTMPPEDWPVEFFAPAAGQIVGALLLIIVGFLVTLAISRIGVGSTAPRQDSKASS